MVTLKEFLQKNDALVKFQINLLQLRSGMYFEDWDKVSGDGSKISSAFSWSDTPEGHDYWWDLDTKFRTSNKKDATKVSLIEDRLIVTFLKEKGVYELFGNRYKGQDDSRSMEMFFEQYKGDRDQSSIISGAFEWSGTLEGVAYWAALSNEFEEVLEESLKTEKEQRYDKIVSSALDPICLIVGRDSMRAALERYIKTI